MNLEQRIELILKLKNLFLKPSDRLKAVLTQTERDNPWFDRNSYLSALERIAEQFLDKNKLLDWVKPYRLGPNPRPKRIGLILAGNIPFVGFHDILSVFISGHIALIKPSQKDRHVPEFVINSLTTIELNIAKQLMIVERLTDYDAVIATGSDNARIHFEHYFRDVPRLLRGNRNSVAVLTGTETEHELHLLSRDIFCYYGLGCRNVSKLYLPKNYDFEQLVSVLSQNKKSINHPKYRNNYDYNLAVLTINRVPHLNTQNLLLIEDKSLVSRIATLHFEYYDNLETLTRSLTQQIDQIQCIVSKIPLEKLPAIPFGDTVSPHLDEYPDRKDTLIFLTDLQSSTTKP